MRKPREDLAKRVRSLRLKAGLSQDELAHQLGVSRPTMSQIETGDRRVSADELPRLADALGTTVGALLGTEREPEVILPRRTSPAVARRTMRISVPQKNLAKFREVLLYVLKKVGSQPNIGETVLYKLLYFIDFDFYERYEEQLIGATYIKNRYGPTPVEFRKVVDQMAEGKEIEKVVSEYFRYPQTKYLPLRNPDLTKLRAHEAQLIDDVLDRLGGMNAAEISRYSHNDVPWLAAREGKSIEYEAVFYRTAPYARRPYSEEPSEG